MTTITHGKKARIISNNNNAYKLTDIVTYIGMDSDVNVNEEYEKYYLFTDSINLIQTLTEEEFEWI